MDSSLEVCDWLRRPALRAVAALVVSFALPGCADCTFADSSGETAQTSQPWPMNSKIAGPVPEAARAVVFVRHLADLERGLDIALDRYLGDDRGATVTTLSRMHEIIRPNAFGFDPEADVAAFSHSGEVGFVVPLASPETFENQLDAFDSTDRVNIRGVDGADLREARFPNASTALQFAVRGDRVLARTAPEDPTSGPDGPPEPRRAFRAFFAEPKPGGSNSTWPRQSPAREVLETVAARAEHPRAVGFTEPGPWLREIESEGRAATLRARLAHQLGPTGFWIDFDRERSQMRVSIRTRAVSGEPTVVSGMGKASGKRPALGGLVEPGVLGVLRCSVDPEKVYRTLVSTLPAEGREQLDVLWRRARRQLLIDGPGEVLENFTGHAAVVFYGLEGDRLDGSGIEVLRTTFELGATREAVLLPIESREKMERLLDKLTQITRGRLSRQRAEHTVQYIRLRDGSLEWALILGDEYLMFVDSATALRKATQYERRGRRLTDEQIETMRIGPLLEGRQRSGLYLDTGTLGELLRENGRGRVAALLAPFRSVVVTSENDGEASRIRLRLHLGDP